MSFQATNLYINTNSLTILSVNCIYIGGELMKKVYEEKIAKMLGKILKASLFIDSNSTSSALLFQLKKPKSIQKYKIRFK